MQVERWTTSIHSATKETPFFLMHGQDARSPTDMLPGELESTPEEYKLDLVQRLKKAQEEVQYLNDRIRQQREAASNEGRSRHTYKEGDLVWIYTYSRKPGYSNKFKKPWQGPFRIFKLLSKVTVKLLYPKE